MWLQSPNINCAHGFSTRLGGVSPAPFMSLNLGGHEDAPENIFQNRKLALEKLSLSLDNLAFLKQVHGNSVCHAKQGIQEGDALVTHKKNLALAISIADCYPLLFYDEASAVIGAAHAGWRGTVSEISATTIFEMKRLGAKTEFIKVAIGQGISQNKFEVGREVIEKFESAGFPSSCWRENKIDLVQCNVHTLLKNGILRENIWTMNRCTFEDDFFSYRRDHGKTGRMWALIAMR